MRKIGRSGVAGLLALGASAFGYETVTNSHVDVVAFDYTKAGGMQGRVGTAGGLRQPGEVLVYDGLETERTRPVGSQWDFLGVAAEESLFIWQQSEVSGRLYAGMDGSSVPTGTMAARLTGDARALGMQRWLKVELVAVRYFGTDGEPGEADFSLWQTGGGTPVKWMATSDGIGAEDVFYVTEGGHAHMNWGFTREGYYQVDFRLSGVLDGSLIEAPSLVTTWHLGVGYSPVSLAGGFPGGPNPVEPNAAPPTVVGGGARPSLKLAGKTRIVTSKRRVVLRGTAADDGGIGRVEVKVAGDRLRPAKGRERWSFAVRLTRPRTRVVLQAVDGTGQRSNKTTVVILRR